VSALVLDAGALIAIDGNDRDMAARLRVAQAHGLDLKTNGVIIAQVWRDARGRQSNLSRLLSAVNVVAVDEHVGRAAGVLLGLTQTTDAADATVVAVAASGDRVLTSDADDIRRLVAASGKSVVVVGV
jgi:predicted nucleic acid-binding protein